MAAERWFFINPELIGGVFKYTNHSCEPTCIARKRDLVGSLKIIIYNLKDIEPAEKLTYDYQVPASSYFYFKRMCLTVNCKTLICKRFYVCRKIYLNAKRDSFNNLNNFKENIFWFCKFYLIKW